MIELIMFFWLAKAVFLQDEKSEILIWEKSDNRVQLITGKHGLQEPMRDTGSRHSSLLSLWYFPVQKGFMFTKIKRKHCKLSEWLKAPDLKRFQAEKMLRNLLEEFVIISLLQANPHYHCLLWKQHHSSAMVGWKVNSCSHFGITVTLTHTFCALS